MFTETDSETTAMLTHAQIAQEKHLSQCQTHKTLQIWHYISNYNFNMLAIFDCEKAENRLGV